MKIILSVIFVVLQISVVTAEDGSTKGRLNDGIFSSWSLEAKRNMVILNGIHDYTFVIEKPAEKIWPCLKDLNLWLEDLDWSAVVGDSEGDTIHFTIKSSQNLKDIADEKTFIKYVRVKKVVPEKLVLIDNVSNDRKKINSTYTFSLHEDNGITTVRFFANYSPWSGSIESKGDLVSGFRKMAENVDNRWRNHYIPRLKALSVNSYDECGSPK